MSQPNNDLIFPQPIETVELERADLPPWVLDRFRHVPGIHREQIEVLTAPCAQQLSRFVSLYFYSDGRPLRNGEVPFKHTKQWPFRRGLFQTVEETARSRDWSDDEVARVRKWLYHKAIPFGRQVYVHVDCHRVFRTTWKLLVKYWDIFQGPSDDTTVFDDSLRWCLFLWHESTAYFGTNEPRSPDPLTWDGRVWLFGPEGTSSQELTSECE